MEVLVLVGSISMERRTRSLLLVLLVVLVGIRSSEIG